MMNRSSTSANPSDPYVPSSSIMSFPGQNHLFEYWDAQNQTPFFDPHPSLFPMNNFPFYYNPTSTGIIKREEGGRIGLNLGHRTYFSSGDELTIDRLLTARAHHHHHPPRCQAEGCKADLSGAKHYHRRHKVCEFHSKATVVIAGGMQQRFCQQCSRFHVLGEFDDSKRSCRKRLADHNRRRRKPQSDQNSSTNSTDHKTKHTTRPPASRDNTASRSTTTTTTTAAITTTISSDKSGNQNKAAAFRSEPALSLGGVDIRSGVMVGSHHHNLYQYNLQQHHFSSPSTSNNSSFFYHQSLFGSSSNEAASQSTGGANFEVDFI